jgi:sugar phosphate isomerase/epimerase
MKLGVATACLTYMSLEETLRYLAPFGFDTFEPSAGGMLSRTHCDPAALLASSTELDRYRELIARHGIRLSNLKAHGNVVHPNRDVAKAHRADFEAAVRLSEKLGLDYILTFSGCPGAPDGGRYPNWISQPYPDEFTEIYNYQWNDVLIPTWIELARFAADHGIKRIGFEMFAGFCVYNTESLLKLRAAVGDIVGCCFDPSHIMPQGMDPVSVIHTLGPIICHVHAKDSVEHPRNVAVNGRYDTKMFTQAAGRAWMYRTLGYGHDVKFWKDIISALTTVGYDGVVSTEHDDCMMPTQEGFEKSVTFLKDILVRGQPTGRWWNHH